MFFSLPNFQARVDTRRARYDFLQSSLSLYLLCHGIFVSRSASAVHGTLHYIIINMLTPQWKHWRYFSVYKHISIQRLSSHVPLPWTQWQWVWCYQCIKHSHTQRETQGHRGTLASTLTGGWSRPRWSAVLPCDSPHTSTLLSRKLKWKCGPWESVAPIYPWTRANDLSFLSGAQADALALTLTMHQRAGQPHHPCLYWIWFPF